MRIREIYFHNVRSFRGEHRISLVDPLTDEVRPVTVIAGTNGTGKTTIFEAIEALLLLATGVRPPQNTFLAEIEDSGLVSLALELYSENRLEDRTTFLHIVFGSKELMPQRADLVWPNAFLYVSDTISQTGDANILMNKLVEGVNQMKQDGGIRGGLIYFPQARQLFPSLVKPGGIKPSKRKRDWISRVTPTNQWNGSLEALWVWQNYLDLEASASGQKTSHMKSFVETVEQVLGEGRRISIREGRAMVPVSWHQNGDESPKVRLDQLPSGEQQCLLLFGELARRRRPGAVILVDEPETSLHPTLQRLVVHQLRQFAREWDSQLIIATHSLEILRAVHESQRIILDQLDVPVSEEETV